MEQRTTQKQERRRFVIVFLIVALVVANVLLIYLIIRNKDARINEINQLLNDQKTQYEKDLQSLNDKLREQIAETDRLEGDNQALTDSLEMTLKEVENVQSSLRNELNISRNQLVFYKQKIDAYEILLRKKDERIKNLTQIAENLQNKNDDLMRTNMDVKGQLADANEKISQANDKIEEAAVLQAENVNVSIIDNKGRKETGGEYRSKKIDKLDISFNIAKNDLAKIGGRDIYMRVLEPAGTVLANPGSSGSFDVDGKNYTYSARQNIIFDNSRQTVRFQFSRTGSFEPGRHRVEFYAEGRRIGTGSFNVR